MALLAAIHADPESNSRPEAAHFHPYLPEPEPPEAPPEMLKAIGAAISQKSRKSKEAGHGG